MADPIAFSSAFFGEFWIVDLTLVLAPSQLKGDRAKLRLARKVAKGTRDRENRVSQQKEGDQNCGFSLSRRLFQRGKKKKDEFGRFLEEEGERGVAATPK